MQWPTRQPTVSRQLADCRSTVGHQHIGQQCMGLDSLPLPPDYS